MSDIIQNEGNPHKYFHIIPNMADDELDLYEYRLYGHYLRVCGANGNTCTEGVRATAKSTHMGVNKVQDTRDSLAQKGYIRAQKPTPEDAQKGKTVHITLLDKWAENMARYTRPVSVGIQQPPVGVSAQIQVAPQAVSPEIHKKNTTSTEEQKTKEQKDFAPVGALATSQPISEVPAVPTSSAATPQPTPLPEPSAESPQPETPAGADTLISPISAASLLSPNSETRVVNFQDVKDHWNAESQAWDDRKYVYIGRSNPHYNLPPSVWANPFKLAKDADTPENRARIIGEYRDWITQQPQFARLDELRGKTLVCWCEPLPCHGDVLLELLIPDSPVSEKPKPERSLKQVERDILVTAVAYAWGQDLEKNRGFSDRLANFMTGKVTKTTQDTEWDKHKPDDPALPPEIIGFRLWWETNPDSLSNFSGKLPTSPKTIATRFEQFRGVPNFDKFWERGVKKLEELVLGVKTVYAPVNPLPPPTPDAPLLSPEESAAVVNEVLTDLFAAAPWMKGSAL